MSGHRNRTVVRRRSGAKRVGVQDWKIHAAGILRELRDSRTPVVLTQRGRAVAMILPIDCESGAAAAADISGEASAWNAFLDAGRRLSPRFKAGKSGIREINEMRR